MEAGRRAALAEGLPLLAASAVFVVLGVIAASRGIDLGPDRIHLSVLLFALAAVAVVGAVLAGLSVAENGGPADDATEAVTRRRRDDLGRPAPGVAREAPAPRPEPPWSERDEPPTRSELGDREANGGAGEEVERALEELDTIRSALDRRPSRKREPGSPRS